MAKDQGRLTDTPHPGYLAFIGLSNQDQESIIHVGIVESVEADAFTIIQGNGLPDRSVVTRTSYRLDDPRVVDFAPFENES
jgi:hypothetical protein